MKEERSPYAQWFTGLNSVAAAKVTTAVYRLEQGSFLNVKGIGEGVFEYRVDFGPGYRIYFGKDRDRIVILVGGGTKKRQSHDIRAAKRCWLSLQGQKETVRLLRVWLLRKIFGRL